MGYEDLSLDLADGVGLITLRRPEKMNAMGPRLVHELLAAAESTRYDDAVRALVITGAGRGFCAGADVSGGGEARELGAELDEANGWRRNREAPIGHWGVLFETLSRYPKPLIAAVNGAAAGAGLSLAMVCDIRIASTQARFISAFVHRAINPDTGSTYHLPRLIGKGRALEMMFTGDAVSAAEAERWGLVNRVVERESVVPEAMALAERIARGPSIAIELTKRLVNESAPDFGVQLEREGWALGVTGATEDREEGIRSFLEKRPAAFRGR